MLWFFLPVVLVFCGLEYATRAMDTSFKKNEKRLEEHSDSIRVLILGSSHMASAINAGDLNTPALNVASGNQHHDTDFKLLKSMAKRLPQLETVVLEVSYGHFEFPHNGSNFWKNSYYLKYYGVNCFGRSTYFKDRLLYASNAPVISERLYDYYITQEAPVDYSAYGFNRNNFFGRFKNLKYNEIEIAKTRFRINKQPDSTLFKQNTKLFFELLDFSAEQNLKVIICTTPMYKTYLPARSSIILKRRDSILEIIEQRYDNTSLLLKEDDTLNFKVRDYWNQSHLNPNGAAKFTSLLQSVLNQQR